MRPPIIGFLFLVGIAGSQSAYPCTRSTPISASEMVADADLIVRATAEAYSVSPQAPLRTTGEPDWRVRFVVREMLKGSTTASEIILPGYLSERDDFNDHPAPYRFVRPNGRSGSCFANTYRSGADFLLVLKRRNDTVTVNWYALGPVNEQLRGPQDPWLLWVRAQLKNDGKQANQRLHPTAVGPGAVRPRVNRGR